MGDTVVARVGRPSMPHGQRHGARAPTSPIPPWAPVALVMLAIPFIRPNIMGEALSPVGFVLVAAAAAATLLRRTEDGARGRIPAGRRAIDPATALIVCLGLGYLWVLIRNAAIHPGPLASLTLQGMVVTVGSLLAIVVVWDDPHARLAIARGFVILVAVLGASYAVSAVIWTVAGVGAGQIGAFPVGTLGPQPVYFPFTTTVGVQPVFGIRLPRFTGLGREPGWMAMYCAIAYFLAEAVGFRNRLVKLLILLGLIGSVSTAGFGVFVVAWAYHRFLRDRGGISLPNYLRQVGGIGAVALAMWLAITAPEIGLSAKATQNDGTSLDARRLATEAGIEALLDDPLGGDYSIPDAGINLISDIASSGLPFVVLVCVGLLLTMVRSGPARSTNAVTVIVFITMLTSQPPRDSTWAFALVVLACMVRRPDTDVDPGPTPRPGTTEGRRSTRPQTTEESP